MRFWDNKEVPGRGTKFCLVIDPQDGTQPIRTYGWSQDEVLDKVAKTAETAQQVINRQRQAQASTVRNPAPAPAATVQPSSAPDADAIMQATADLQNPAKSSEAIKVLLRSVGVDVDKMKLQDDLRRVASFAQEWERQHPEFPSDERNQRLLMDRASLITGGIANVTVESFDAAFEYLQAHGLLFEVQQPPAGNPVPSPNPQDAPGGNLGTRTERRSATTYRSATLRSGSTVAPQVKPKWTMAQVEAMNSAELRDKLQNEPGFKQWLDQALSSSVA